ncbi:GrpB family protein [Halobium palmae]|uniref:GrpB family protein n=1 Tax=Halobium palmae TaxID=1776492 RepID=A0ABD5RVL1_9EURY
MGDDLISIEHLGSANVPGLGAETIINILPTVPDMDAAHACESAMSNRGYRFSIDRSDCWS